MKKHIDTHRRPTLSMQAMRGLRGIAREYGNERIDTACHRALRISATSVSSVRSMPQRRIENTPLRDFNEDAPQPGHDNVRGAKTYES